MSAFLLAAIIVCAAAAIIVDWDETHAWLFKILKPLTTLLVIALAAQAPPTAYLSWVIVGLILSLCGDVALTSESDRSFVIGLASFLLAHAAFMVAFLGGVDPAMPAAAWSIAAYGVVFFSLTLPSVPREMRAPVVVYGVVLCAMAIAALLRALQMDEHGPRLALIGALLFVVSDSALARNRFVGSFPGAQPVILSTYWAAIVCIAASVPQHGLPFMGAPLSP